MPNFVPRLFATSVIIGIIGCAGPSAPDSFAGAPSAGPSTATTPSPTLVASTISSVLTLTNAERRQAGVPELRENNQLTHAAQLQSEQMGSMSHMDHVLPGAPYPSPPDRLAAVSYEWSAYGENVAMGQHSGTEVVTAWMNSPGHRANILNPAYTEIGVGYALDNTGRPYYAQVFARPAK